MSKKLAVSPEPCRGRLEKKKLKLERYRAGKKELERFMKTYGRLRNLEGVATGETPWEKEVKKEAEAEKVRLCKMVKKHLQQTREIDNAIEELSDSTQALILRYRYIDGMAWEDITEELCYSIRNVHYMHNKALESLVI